MQSDIPTQMREIPSTVGSNSKTPMAFKSPIHDLHTLAGALFTDYGISDPQGQLGAAGSGVIPVVASYGELALEYTSLRRACVILDLPQRGLIEVTGPDAASFLNRMVTQELKDIAEGQLRHSFWLNRKGRIDADLNIFRQGNSFLLELDALGRRHAAGIARGLKP